MTTAGHTAHTPWHVADNPVGNSGAEVHANVKVKSKLVVCRIGGPDRSANAALIAMAPDLLAERDRLLADNKRLREALQWALPLAELTLEETRVNRIRCGHSDIRCGDTIGLWPEEAKAREKARAALGGDHAGRALLDKESGR